jgi:NADH-quinone oxidoreductase subunit C
MASKTEALTAALAGALGDASDAPTVARGEVTLVVAQSTLIPTMRALRDRAELRFELLSDVCGVDYSTWGGQQRAGPRYAVVYHLLSLAHNWRLRVRCFAPDDSFPVVPSAVDIWPGANWFEREAFDLYGIMFPGHPDLRPHPHRLRLRRASVPQGFPDLGPRRDALRPGAGSRDLPAGDDRAARDHAADRPRGHVRNW